MLMNKNNVNNAENLGVTSTDLLDNSLSLDGVWTSRGAFTIQWHDEDHVKVTKHWMHFDDEAILTGGDFETVLETLFTKPEITRKYHQKSLSNAKFTDGERKKI
jgi:hypothetical protein